MKSIGTPIARNYISLCRDPIKPVSHPRSSPGGGKLDPSHSTGIRLQVTDLPTFSVRNLDSR